MKLPESRPKATEKFKISEQRSCISLVCGTRLGAWTNAVDKTKPFETANANCTVSEYKSLRI